jgi:GNAT superfamily N-acetyltransferase
MDEVSFQQVDFLNLSAEMGLKLEKMGFPPPQIDPGDMPVAFAAFINSELIGLIHSSVFPNIQHASIVFFLVDPAHRNRGIGSRLMAALLEHLKSLNIKVVRISYIDNNNSIPALEKILQKTGWATPPKILLRSFFLDQYSFHPDWFFSPFPALPQDYSLFLWKDATPEDLQQAKEWEGGNPLIALYSPFNTKYPIADMNSLGIRYKGHIVGWMIVQRVNPKLIIYSGLFIIPEHRGIGPSICLLKEAIRRHLNREIDTVAIVEINEEVSPSYWNRFIEKRLAPFAFQVETLFLAYKVD